MLGSTDPNMRAFFARGGKLLLYHGWSDAQVTPYNTINFFQKVVASQGGAGVGTSMQLYMVPGMNHCAGGPGTDMFDKMAAIEEWIKTGTAPKRIEASHVTSWHRRSHAAALSVRAGRAVERHAAARTNRPTSPASPPRWNPRGRCFVRISCVHRGRLSSRT